jgi:hypothetical protein
MEHTLFSERTSYMNAKVKLHGLSYGSLFENFIDAIITTLHTLQNRWQKHVCSVYGLY